MGESKTSSADLNYRAVLVQTEPGQLESWAALLWDLETLGFEELDGPPHLLKAFFQAEKGSSELLSALSREAESRKLSYSDLSTFILRSDPADWLASHRKYFRGFAVSDRIYVYPSWEGPSPSHIHNILMEPGRAFGTGTHESTQLCLLALEEALSGMTTMLDVGTGSGILSIGVRLIAPNIEVVAIDSDPVAIEVARHNLAVNALKDVSLVVAEPASLKTSFDLVVANLTFAIIRQQLDHLLALSSRRVLFSGVTEDQESWLTELLIERGWASGSCWRRNGWVCLGAGRSGDVSRLRREC